MTHVFMFPGQSSRYVGMLDRIAEVWPRAKDVVADASEIVGRDLGKLYREGDESLFAKNRNVQVGVFLTTHLHLSALQSMGVDARYSLGMSLGEFNHLVHIGALIEESQTANQRANHNRRRYRQAQVSNGRPRYALPVRQHNA